MLASLSTPKRALSESDGSPGRTNCRDRVRCQLVRKDETRSLVGLIASGSKRSGIGMMIGTSPGPSAAATLSKPLRLDMAQSSLPKPKLPRTTRTRRGRAKKTRGPRNLSGTPKTLPKTCYYGADCPTTYARPGRFVIGRSAVRVRWSAPGFAISGVFLCVLANWRRHAQARRFSLHVRRHDVRC